MVKKVIITDLDYTLLDSNYSFEPASEVLTELRRRGIPVILCTSKTFAETDYFRRKMGLDDPFVVENGGAFYIPETFLKKWGLNHIKVEGEFFRKAFGVPIKQLESFIEAFRKKTSAPLKTYFEMDRKQLLALTGLPPHLLELSLRREFDLPFIFQKNGDRFRASLEEEAGKQSLKVQKGGIFYHLSGTHTKATALKELFSFLSPLFDSAEKIALGDSPNDLEMLREADIPVIVAKPGGVHDTYLVKALRGAVLSEGVGPEGWARAVLSILKKGGEWDV